MGIPKFARWLINRYPLILKKIETDIDVPETDHLYLDINGIIHNQSHNNDLLTLCQLKSYDEIYYDIFLYVDQLVHIIKPKKLLMISADGVAPRAKMNQQRARRFTKESLPDSEIKNLKNCGIDPENIFNSNCISPGTEFMSNLMKAFDFFIASKINTDPLWKNIKVLFSGSDVEGEGEHKITEYIRHYKDSKEYVPDTKFCIYGLDADLIMLSLITHEPNVTVLREEVIFGKKDQKPKNIVKQRQEFEFISVSILREYLEMEFFELKRKLTFSFNIERIIDDLVFFCFFIGNDFLPSLNTLDIAHGSLDEIFKIYKETLPGLPDYLTYHGKINFQHVRAIFEKLAKHEENNLKKMLRNLESQIKENKVRNKIIADEKKKKQFARKLAQKKEKKLLYLQSLEKHVREKYKKDKINKKIEKNRTLYSEIILRNNKVGTFEEDAELFIKSKYYNNYGAVSESEGYASCSETEKKPEKNYERLTEKKIKKKKVEETKTLEEKSQTATATGEVLEEKNDNNLNPAICSIFPDDDDLPQSKKGKKIIKRKENIHPNTNTSISGANVEVKFVPLASASEIQPVGNNSRSLETYNEDINAIVEDEINLNRLLQDSAKYIKYIKDINYYSDVDIDDINDSDISVITEKDLDYDYDFMDDGESQRKMVENEELEKNQDLEEQFQKKLVNLYCNNLNQAKKFYYSVKLKFDLDTDEGKGEFDNMFSKYLEGLQWVLYYYYRGVISWQWYYPYHHPPMVSDFVQEKFPDIKNDESMFEKDDPYLPFQTLLMILPETSKALVPKCYHNIFKDLSEFYPVKFGLDFNGKRNPWEAIVVLPFVEAKRVVDYETTIRNSTNGPSKEELERNTRGVSYMYAYNSSNENKFIPISTQFQGFQHKDVVRVERSIYHIYKEGVKTSLERNYELKLPAYNFPTLSFLDYKSYLDEKRDSRFGNKNPSFKVQPKLQTYSLNETAFMNLLQGILKKETEVFFGAYKEEGYLQAIVTPHGYYYMEDKKLKTDINYRTDSVRKTNLRGLDCYNAKYLCEIYPLKRIARNSDGTLIKIYQLQPLYVPFEATHFNCKDNNRAEDFKKLKQDSIKLFAKYTNIQTEFPLNTPTIMLDKSDYGQIGYVNKYITKSNSNNYSKLNEKNYSKLFYDDAVNFDLQNEDWTVHLDSLYKGTLIDVKTNPRDQLSIVNDNTFARNIIKNNASQYISIEELSKELNISTEVLKMISSNLMLTASSNELVEISGDSVEQFDIGLGLFSGLNVIPGYATIRIVDTSEHGNRIELSPSAKELIIYYRDNFGFVFTCLKKYKDIYKKPEKFLKISQLFSTEDKISQKLESLRAWLTKIPTKQISPSFCNSKFASAASIAQINEFVLKSLEANQKMNSSNVSMNHYVVLNPNYLFCFDEDMFVPPFVTEAPAKFEIGDRVININCHNIRNIPFGLKGTVTAVLQTFVEVLFDVEFFGGVTCGGRLPKCRGAYVLNESLINLTTKMPVFLRRNEAYYPSWDYSTTATQTHHGKPNVNLVKSISQEGYSDNYYNEFSKGGFTNHEKVSLSANKYDKTNSSYNTYNSGSTGMQNTFGNQGYSNMQAQSLPSHSAQGGHEKKKYNTNHSIYNQETRTQDHPATVQATMFSSNPGAGAKRHLNPVQNKDVLSNVKNNAMTNQNNHSSRKRVITTKTFDNTPANNGNLTNKIVYFKFSTGPLSDEITKNENIVVKSEKKEEKKSAVESFTEVLEEKK